MGIKRVNRRGHFFWSVISDRTGKELASSRVSKRLPNKATVKEKFNRDKTLIENRKIVGKETFQQFIPITQEEKGFPGFEQLNIPKRKVLDDTGYQYYVKIRVVYRNKIRVSHAYSPKRYDERTAQNLEDARNEAIINALGGISKTFYAKDFPDDLEVLEERLAYFGRR